MEYDIEQAQEFHLSRTDFLLLAWRTCGSGKFGPYTLFEA